MKWVRLLSLSSVFVLFLLDAQPVLAHANFVRSEPPANSAQKVPPVRVRVWFSEEVEPSFTTVSVLTASGTPVDKGDSRRIAGDAKAMEVSLSDLPLGLYTVSWKALSAVDGHVTSGSFAFTVGDVPLSESSPREVIALVDSALSASAPPPAYEYLVRGLNLLLLVQLAGSFAFPLFILLPSIQNARTRKANLAEKQIDSARAAWARRWLRVLFISLILYGLITVVVLIAQSLSAGGLTSLSRVLTSTRFGVIWLLRVAILIALGALIFRSRWRWLDDFKLDRALLGAAGLSLLLLLLQSLNSHGAAITDPPFLALAIDFIHLLGSAVWIGGVIQLMLTLPAFIRRFDFTQQPRALAFVIARFSLIAFLTVNLILASGVYSMVVQVGSVEALFATLYGTTLLVKFLLIGLLLAVAAFNLIVVRPSLAQAVVQRAVVLTRHFRRAIALEAFVGISALFVVGLLTSVAPARSAYEPSPKLVLQTQRVDDLLVTLGIAPGLVGTNDFDVKVQDASGQPVANASVVRLLGTHRDMDMGTQEMTATPQGDGHYTLHGDLLSMIGNWQLEVLVRREGHDDARKTFALLALDRRAPPQTPWLLVAVQQPEVLLGLSLTFLGFAVGTASVLVGRLKQQERWATLAGAIGVSVLGALVVIQTPINVAQPAAPIAGPIAPEFARFLRSPIAPDPDHLSNGSKIYAQSCAMCHGASGKGNGPLAASLNPKPVDLTVHARLHTEGELFWWVTNGIPGTAMPKWEPQLNDLQRWEVVAFIRTLGAASATATPPAQRP